MSRDMFIYILTHPNIGCVELLYISAWAFALLVSAGWAMRRPLVAGRVTGTDSRAFSFYMVNLILLFEPSGSGVYGNLVLD